MHMDKYLNADTSVAGTADRWVVGWCAETCRQLAIKDGDDTDDTIEW